MYILGIGCYYHDASAALLKDGTLVAAAEEERFTRKKHDNSFPINSIKYCLQSQNIGINDIAYIAFYEKPMIKFERILYQHLEMFPKSYKTFVKALPSWINEKLRLRATLKKKLRYRGDIFFIDHHYAHAASGFLVSPFEKAAILTVDGVGEWTTAAYGIGENNEIMLQKELKFPHSLGLLYSAITAYLGFSVNNSEYKVMGLSAYGDMNRNTNQFYEKLRRVIDIRDDGSFALDMSYFTFHYKESMPSKKLCKLLGGSITKKGTEMKKRHKDVAAALQILTEEVLARMLFHVHKNTGCDNIVLAGGVALNSVFNGKILKNTPFKNVWIQPDAGDGGASLGAAFYVYNTILGKKRGYVMETASIGLEYSKEQVHAFLEETEIKYSECKDNEELLKRTSQLIYSDNVVGWFQGRMEFGPRALGNRSILSNPCNPKMQEILNEKVKHRETFRPFAPAVCSEDAQKYFECDIPIPKPADFMLMVYPIKKRWQQKLPAVTHVDGSGRLQTVERNKNQLFYGLIKEFGRLSGIPILINTSFNVRGEPIVCTPDDAYKCVMGTKIDYLVISNFIIKRSDNLKDSWDSEKYAHD
jgi:carbamoyltransferase